MRIVSFLENLSTLFIVKNSSCARRNTCAVACGLQYYIAFKVVIDFVIVYTSSERFLILIHNIFILDNVTYEKTTE